MPLTSHSILLDDIENNRRIARELEARSLAATKMGTTALADMEALAKGKREEERQAGLDKQEAEGITLTRKNDAADQARKAAAEARAGELHGLDLVKRGQEGDERDASAMRLKRKEADETGRQAIADAVAAGTVGQEREVRARLIDDPRVSEMSPDVVDALFAKRAKDEGAKALDVGMDEREQLRKEADSKAGRARDYAAAKVSGKPKERIRLQKTLGPNDIQDMAQRKQGLDSLRQLRTLKQSVDTGQLAGRVQKGVASVAEQEAWRKFSALNGLAVRTIGKAVEGGRMTDADARAYEKILMDPVSDDAEYMGVLDLVEGITRQQYEMEVAGLTEAGIPVPSSLRTATSKATIDLSPEEFDSLPPEEQERRLDEAEAGGG